MDSGQLNEIFFHDDYSIENLLNKTRQNGLSLGKLRQILLQYQQDLNQSSLELFDNNYDRFYKLSYIISRLREPIEHLTEPIVSFRDKIEQVCKNLDEYLKQIDEKLISLEETSKNKLLSRRLIDLIRRRDRIEKQLNTIDWSVRALDRTNLSRQDSLDRARARDEDVEFQIKCDHLERVSVELYYLHNELRALKPTHDELIPIKRALEVGLEEQQLQLDSWFEGAFLEAMELQDRTVINLVVRTYQQRNALNKIDTVWRKKIVRPHLDLTLTQSQLTNQTIIPTYNLLSEFLRRKVELIGNEFVVKSFWIETAEALGKLDKLYSLENLDKFKVHYEATRKFLDEQYFYKESCDAQLADHNSQLILGKFNLKGYFNQRLSQIASSVESSLTSNPLSEIPNRPDSADKATNDASSCFKIKICMHIYRLVIRCWSPELYIDALEMSFVQLACRILNRFANWLGKLRLSDFRITGSSSLDKQTNFLAKQDAIMRLLLDDCDLLAKQIRQNLIESQRGQHLGHEDQSSSQTFAIREELIQESLTTLNCGLSNVRSLRRLIER